MNDKSILDILEQDEPFKWRGKNYNSFKIEGTIYASILLEYEEYKIK